MEDELNDIEKEKLFEKFSKAGENSSDTKDSKETEERNKLRRELFGMAEELKAFRQFHAIKKQAFDDVMTSEQKKLEARRQFEHHDKTHIKAEIVRLNQIVDDDIFSKPPSIPRPTFGTSLFESDSECESYLVDNLIDEGYISDVINDFVDIDDEELASSPNNKIRLSFYKIFSGLIAKDEIKILMVGLEGAGKTSILSKFKLGEIITTVPTIGFHVQTVEYENISITVWDVGGDQEKIRPLWRHYIRNAKGLIFVVDSNDRDRVDEARSELHNILSEDELQGARVLILYNKQDLPNAIDASEITDKLDLRSIRQRHRVQGTCAKTGQGIYEGLDWLSNSITE